MLNRILTNVELDISKSELNYEILEVFFKEDHSFALKPLIILSEEKLHGNSMRDQRKSNFFSVL